jgi:hypothetical protein
MTTSYRRNTMNIYTITAEAFLAELFADEYCVECGGDVQHHTAVPFAGNWFARCDFPYGDDGEQHPVIVTYRAVMDTTNPQPTFEAILAEARGLVSEHGENPEYDRAIVELVTRLFGLSHTFHDAGMRALLLPATEGTP